MSDAASDEIRLDQFLKLQGLARSGGEAKAMIRGGEVKVDGAVETRRGRKLLPGSVVEVGEDRVVVEREGD